MTITDSAEFSSEKIIKILTFWQRYGHLLDLQWPTTWFLHHLTL